MLRRKLSFTKKETSNPPEGFNHVHRFKIRALTRKKTAVFGIMITELTGATYSELIVWQDHPGVYTTLVRDPEIGTLYFVELASSEELGYVAVGAYEKDPKGEFELH